MWVGVPYKSIAVSCPPPLPKTYIVGVTGCINGFTNHYEILPMHYTEIFEGVKAENFFEKQIQIVYIYIFFSKHRLWVYARTASPSRFYLTSMHILCFRRPPWPSDISLLHLTIRSSHRCVWCGFEPRSGHI